MEELKPCPFCGEVPFIEKEPLWRNYGDTTRGYKGCYKYVIKCRNPKCGCCVNLGKNDTIYNKDKEAIKNAIEAWNRRTENEIRTFEHTAEMV